MCVGVCNCALFARFLLYNQQKQDTLNKGCDFMGLENRLKEYRARLNLNQSELGKLAHVSRQTISLIERGDYSPSVTLALKLAQIFEVSVEDIFIYQEDEDNDEK